MNGMNDEWWWIMMNGDEWGWCLDWSKIRATTTTCHTFRAVTPPFVFPRRGRRSSWECPARCHHMMQAGLHQVLISFHNMEKRSFRRCGMWNSWHLLKTESFPSAFTICERPQLGSSNDGHFGFECGNGAGLLLGQESFFGWHSPAAPCLHGVLPAGDDHQSGDRDDEDFEFTAADTWDIWDADQNYAVLCSTVIWCDVSMMGLFNTTFLTHLSRHFGLWATTARIC